jgi:hypothetical protein
MRPGVVVTHHVAKSMPVTRNYVEWGVEVRWHDLGGFVWAQPKKSWRQWEIAG